MDEFTISIPREDGFSTVAGLVVGGIAARHDVTLEVLDDVQLALVSLLDRDADGAEVTLVLRIADSTIDMSVGPVDDGSVAALAEDDDRKLGLRRLLDATVDDVSLSERDGETWVELRKDYLLDGADR